jgi:hypothetical protein
MYLDTLGVRHSYWEFLLRVCKGELLFSAILFTIGIALVIWGYYFRRNKKGLVMRIIGYIFILIAILFFIFINIRGYIL